ncbi:MAG: glutamate--cysteine ligase, partial [Desulfovibrionaceae bacterium]|nr:glutamate--cysteine ligase [Desulfovibrionaceae bacterium]
MTKRALGLFEAVGLELEYMIVAARGLSVLPVADEALRAAAGSVVSEIEMGRLSWSNELCLHVIELKTNGPAPDLRGLAAAFSGDVSRINAILAPLGGRLMPGGAHPFMDPARETKLWNHEYSQVYEAYDRIFQCTGHGWSNLQSMHINLPFAGDEEFGRLHAAIRLLLPIMPALAASTPMLDARPTGFMDSRLMAYRDNSRRVPSVAGLVVPEPVFTRAGYERAVLEPMYADIAPHDPQGILRHEWLNSRGAIARFERGAIEIRVLDTQERPAADLAVAALATGALEALCRERFGSFASQKEWAAAPLAELLWRCARDADEAVVDDPRYARALGFHGPMPCTAADLWRALARVAPEPPDGLGEALRIILEQGCL